MGFESQTMQFLADYRKSSKPCSHHLTISCVTGAFPDDGAKEASSSLSTSSSWFSVGSQSNSQFHRRHIILHQSVLGFENTKEKKVYKPARYVSIVLGLLQSIGLNRMLPRLGFLIIEGMKTDSDSNSGVAAVISSTNYLPQITIHIDILTFFLCILVYK
ncbi:hypothetical protein YC2023_044800 [Brassica napus]